MHSWKLITKKQIPNISRDKSHTLFFPTERHKKVKRVQLIKNIWRLVCWKFRDNTIKFVNLSFVVTEDLIPFADCFMILTTIFYEVEEDLYFATCSCHGDLRDIYNFIVHFRNKFWNLIKIYFLKSKYV